MKRETKDAIKVILAILIFVAGFISAVYFGLWIMFIKAIMVACAAFDAGTLTATLVGWTIIKCLLATTVAGLILTITGGIAKALLK